jgi:hypothetical protein
MADALVGVACFILGFCIAIVIVVIDDAREWRKVP